MRGYVMSTAGRVALSGMGANLVGASMAFLFFFG